MLRNRTINAQSTILEALKKMDSLDKKLLVVMESNIFVGLISAGDIQRAIIQNKSLNTIVKDILRENIKIAKPGDSFGEVKKMMFDFRMELCPVVDEKNEIIEVYFWEDIFRSQKPQPLSRFDLPVIIMSGGFGTRMKPLTNVFPKPLLPIGEKTMLEEIFDRFSIYGCKRFFVTLNYRADLIKYYINQLRLPFFIEYFTEKEPLGTAGSLSLLKGKINETFFINNCDILIEQDYSEILEYHKVSRNEITIIAALKHYPLAYGTIQTGEDGQLYRIEEKPEFSFKINSGMYLMEPGMLDLIPVNKFINITDLLNNLNQNGRKIGVYPVSEKSWKDLGNWPDFLRINNL